MKFDIMIFQNQPKQLEIDDLQLQHPPQQIKLTNWEQTTVVVMRQQPLNIPAQEVEA